jgi:hypothetical protein
VIFFCGHAACLGVHPPAQGGGFGSGFGFFFCDVCVVSQCILYFSDKLDK